MRSDRIVVVLPGLSCAPCVPDIEVAVRSVEGVIWAILNYAAEELTIIYDPTAVSSRTLLKLVQRLGADPSLEGARIKSNLVEPHTMLSAGAVRVRHTLGRQERERS